jgi:hypothetical protein
VKEDSLRFPTVHSRTSTGQRIKSYDFSENDGAAENFISVQIATSKEKSIMLLFGWDYSLEMNTKNLDNSPILPSVTYSAPSE